jgi:hypothetical protein
VPEGWVPEGWVPEGWVPEGWVPEGETDSDGDVVPSAVAESVGALVEVLIDGLGVPLLGAPPPGSSWLAAAVGVATEDAGGPLVAAL